jgi:hypothetical protein
MVRMGVAGLVKCWFMAMLTAATSSTLLKDFFDAERG